MRFYLVLAAIALVLFFCFRSCSSKFLPSKSPDKQTSLPSKSTLPLPPPASNQSSSLLPSSSLIRQDSDSSRYVSPSISEVYVFKNRLVPSLNAFSIQPGGNSNSVSVTIDEPSNSILIRGAIDSVRALLSSARQLDVESQEAYCDAWMLFVRGDKVRDFEAGLSWSEGGFSSSGSATISSEGFGVSIPFGVLRARLDVMASNGLLEVVDRPQLRLSSGHRSEVSTGEEVPFPTTVIRDGVATTSIEFKRVGLLFQVDPLFLSRNRVRMDVVAENGLLGATRKVGDVEVPSISRQSVRSAATLGYDDAMVIGGLETVRREKRFGLFGEKETTQSGRLYVAIMLRSGVPKAKPVIGPAPDFPLIPPNEKGSPGIYDDQLLPPKGWFDFPDGVKPRDLPIRSTK